MKKQEIYDYLRERNIWFEVTEHEAVFNMEELSSLELPYPEADAKNLFVRDDKRNHYYLITVKGDKRVNLKDFRKKNQTRPLSFASESELMSVLGLIPGVVTPLGLLNDQERRVQFYLDQEFMAVPGIIGIHPNDNTATIWLKTEDLIAVIKEHGSQVCMIEEV